MEKLQALDASCAKSNFVYATWRQDKEAVEGYSRELISSDFKYIQD
jgi:hypothetical protein